MLWCNLIRISNGVDSQSMLIHVRGANGRKDRYTLLSESALKVSIGSSPTDLEAFVRHYAPKPLGAPIKNALLSVLEPTGAVAPLDSTGEEEADGEPEYY